MPPDSIDVPVFRLEEAKAKIHCHYHIIHYSIITISFGQLILNGYFIIFLSYKSDMFNQELTGC